VTLTRRDLARALVPLPAAGPESSHPHHDEPYRAGRGAAWTGVQVGVALPESFGPIGDPADQVFTICASFGVQVIEIRGPAVEGMLGAPAAPALWLPSPGEALEAGLLAIEEEMLDDERDLARQSFAARLRGWRSAAPLAPLGRLRARASAAGTRFGIVSWDDLAAMPAEEADYAFRVAHALGASALSTAFSFEGLVGLAATAQRHRIAVGLRGDASIGAAEYEAAFECGAYVGAALDLTSWVRGGHGSPLAFVQQHAGRITHVTLEADAADRTSGPPFGSAADAIRDVLEEMRDRAWPFPAVVTLARGDAADAVTTDDDWGEPEPKIGLAVDQRQQWRALKRAIDYCRACLSG
jgi:hypothetical protein